jgi:hypothetical protein
MPDLVAFLTARLDEDEATARAAMEFTTGDWHLIASCTIDLDAKDVPIDGGGVVKAGTWDGVIGTDSDPGVARHIVRHRPPLVLAEVAARRTLIEEFQGASAIADDDPCDETKAADRATLFMVLRTLAEPYVDHPDYDRSDPPWRMPWATM